ncbi:hypothetical protein SHIRM173S_10131 [Streptomyces hirsutus]
MARITINGVSVDPLAQRNELADASLIAEDVLPGPTTCSSRPTTRSLPRRRHS